MFLHVHSGTNKEGASAIRRNDTSVTSLICYEPNPTIDECSESCSGECRTKLLDTSVCITDDHVKFILNFIFVV